MQNAPKQKTLKRPPKKVAKVNPKCSGAKSKSIRGGKSGGNDGTKTKEEVMVEFEVAAVKLKVVVVVELNLAFQNQSYLYNPYTLRCIETNYGLFFTVNRIIRSFNKNY